MSDARPRRIGGLPTVGRLERAAELLAVRGPTLRAVARRFSANPEDADDAYQRAAEILLRKGPELEQSRLLAWMKVVIRHEALAVGRQRRRLAEQAVGRVAALESVASSRPGPLAVIEARERVAAAAGELRTLKPQERRALALQAAGCSYAEIQAITGWTHTKVNRCLAEGRARLRVSQSAAA